MTHLFIYRLRNCGDLEPIVEELSAVYDKKTLLQIYHEAVDEPYSFLYVNLIQKDKRKIVMTRFQNYLNPSYIFYFIILYIMTTLTNSEGNILNYTNELIETILLHLNSSNKYYTTGDDDIVFIKIGSTKVLPFYYTYHINIILFRIIMLMRI